MTDMKFYGHEKPKLNTLVNFKAINKKDGYFECILIDYDLLATLPFKYATQKKKVNSWNKILSLNKEIIGYIEEVEENNIILSICFLDQNDDSYKNFLIEKSENIKLKSIFTKYSFSKNKDLQNLWEKYIYPLDTKRRKKKKILTLYQYVLKNSVIFDDELLEFFNNEINKINTNENKISTNIGIISFDGVSVIKNIVNEILDETKLKLEIIVSNVPNYKIISNHPSIKLEDHKEFINLLETKVKNKNIFLNLQ